MKGNWRIKVKDIEKIKKYWKISEIQRWLIWDKTYYQILAKLTQI